MAPKPQKTADVEADIELDTEQPIPDTEQQPAFDAEQPAFDGGPSEKPVTGGPAVEPSDAAADVPYGSLRVDVKANLSLQGVGVLQVNQGVVTVPDTEEVRSCIAAGYLEVVEG